MVTPMPTSERRLKRNRKYVAGGLVLAATPAVVDNERPAFGVGRIRPGGHVPTTCGAWVTSGTPDQPDALEKAFTAISAI